MTTPINTPPISTAGSASPAILVPNTTTTTPVSQANDFYTALSAELTACESVFTLTAEDGDAPDTDALQVWLNGRDDVKSASWEKTSYGDSAEFKFTITYRQEAVLICAYRSGDATKLTSVERDALAETRRVVASVIQPEMSEYEKEKAIHDYIVTTCEYDSGDLTGGTVPENAYTPYGVLIDKKAVCDGYSSTFKLFMDMLGIECVTVRGSAGGEGHSWNLVKIAGEWYWIDVTWDDPVYLDGQMPPAGIRYDWFNVTDSVINKNHQPDSAPDVICSSTAYNYFYYNDLVAGSGDELRSMLKKSAERGDTYISLLYMGIPLSNDKLSSLFPPSVYLFNNDPDTDVVTVYFH